VRSIANISKDGACDWWGVTVSNITAASAGTQLSLFPASEDDKRARLAQTVDQVRARFGDRSLVRARLLHGPQLPKK